MHDDCLSFTSVAEVYSVPSDPVLFRSAAGIFSMPTSDTRSEAEEEEEESK